MRSTTDTAAIIREFRGYLTLERGLAENTATAYEFDLQKLLPFLAEEGVLLQNVTYNHLENFAATLYDLGIADSSRKRILAGIKTFFHFLKIAGFIADDPSLLLETPRLGTHLPEVLTVEEIDSLIAAIDPEKAEAERNHAIIETLYGCGMRVSELVNLEFSQFMLNEEFIIVHGKGNKERMVPVSPVAAACIVDYVEGTRTMITPRKGEENIVFLSCRGTRLSRQMIFIMIKRLAAAAGIEKAISPHTLRHSFATHLLEGGANLRAIQQMLGHESISTTEIYLNIDNTHLRSEILLHHPRNAKLNSNRNNPAIG